MGVAIQYCIFCQNQIPPKDVTDGKAIPRPGGYVCAACATKAGLEAERPARSKTPTPSPRRLSGILTPTPKPRMHSTPPQGEPISHASHSSHGSHPPQASRGPAKRSPVPIILGGIGLVVLILIVVMLNQDHGTPASSGGPKTEEPSGPDPKVARQRFALDEAKKTPADSYEAAIAAFRAAAAILPGSDLAREAERLAKDAEGRLADAAQKAFDDVKSKADEWEVTGQFAGAREEWDHFPQRFLVGDFIEKVAAEKKAIDERQASIDGEAEVAAQKALREAAALADQGQYEKAIAVLEAFPAKYKSTKWASDVTVAKVRYHDVIEKAAKAAGGDLASAEQKCVDALVAGDVAAARKVWEAMSGGPNDSAAKAELKRLSDVEKDIQEDGVATWARGTHLVVMPRGGKAWQGQTKGNILVRGSADLEGDGVREVFVGIDGHKEDAGAVVCMTIDGSRRWQFNTGAKHWNGQGVTDEMSVTGLRIVDLDGDGKKETVSVSNHIRLYPCRVCVISWEGKLLSEFWNPGHGGQPQAGDVDGDGKPELFVPFVNNDLGGTQYLACFHGADVRGEAPSNAGQGTGSYAWYTKLEGAKAPLTRIVFLRKKEGGPVTELQCDYQDGTWRLSPKDGSVIKKP